MPARPPFLLYSDGSMPLARVKKKGVVSETTSYSYGTARKRRTRRQTQTCNACHRRVTHLLIG